MVEERAEERRVLIVAYDDAQILDIACPAGAFEIANAHRAAPAYTVEVATPGGRAARTSCGLRVGALRAVAEVPGRVDTLLVSGGAGSETAARDGALVAQVRRLARGARRVASVCTGTDVLAAAGLLDNRRVTTHWRYGRALAERHPAVAVDPTPLYVRDGHVFTSAGVVSGLDLALALVEDDHGPVLARAVARELVTWVHRPADQAQLSASFAAPPPRDRAVADLLRHVAGHLTDDLSPRALAARAGVSPRHLTRLFAAHLGVTPARAVRAARAEAAVHLLRASSLPLAAVARRCGFGSATVLRQALLDHYGATGDTLRRMRDTPTPREPPPRQASVP
ncbi:Transcriptional regulator GlxA family, contains an amidase domain and an AraC-type DNA-binding HTH domain [Streptomyces zhaozhouensis]|uniref:Transcriptional regulator GlxA family, contains an amidase domain and an AraC-type DNA-binding HTH domain n=1 Tax=Streptomyces zhaozhouensis TaxID=1300267 RepID=A0A286DUL5_9ACTN|nr:DJ-1/PfpI family protein [Streptomyces zhaozhouensis]SOD62254.1 Transcriptional regulator GlxA family, contains an amidase domain and an AraC-type DNA-binding HTH domain [Streptomyces zhaozhouensis]